MNSNELVSQFIYYPPKTEVRKQKHERVNQAALEFAKVIFECIEKSEYQSQCLQNIQIARMVANQAITFEEVVPDM